MTHWPALIPSPNLFPLVESAFRGLLLAVLVAALLAVLRVRHVIAQKSAWLCVLACALAMPLLFPLALRLPIPDSATAHLFLHRTQRITATTVATPITPAITEFRTVQHIGPVTDADDPIARAALPRSGNAPSSGAGASSSPTAFPQAPPAAPVITRAQFLLLLYAAVCATLLFRLVRGAAIAVRLWQASEPVDPGLLSPFIDEIPVRSSLHIASPINIASGILLPDDYASWDREKLSTVLAHEASHVRQRDFYLQLLTNLYAAIFWFSPLGWWMQRRLSDLSEAISDRAALQQAASPASYAQILLQFGAQPRLAHTTGVAMARPGRLSRRIETLLNENSFRQAFSATRIRTAAALLLIPAALFAATALVRVQAAAQTPQPPAPAVAPEQIPPPPAVAAPTAAPQQPAQPAPEPNPAAKPQAMPPSAPNQPAEPPAAELTSPIRLQIPATIAISPETQALIKAQTDKIRSNMLLAINTHELVTAKVRAQMAQAMAKNGAFGYWLGNNSDPYAIVVRSADNGTVHIPKIRIWHDGTMEAYKAEIDKAKQLTHGDLIWFRRDGKFYMIDDPSILAQIKPTQGQIDALAKQQEALGKQQEALGKQQEELGRQMEQVKVPTPDMQKELAKLNAVRAKLAALQGKDTSQEQLSGIQNELAEVQGRIGAIQGNMGGRMGDLGGKMGALGGQQGELGAKQGRLGAEQGRLARELDGKVLSLIDECLKNGKAKPVN